MTDKTQPTDAVAQPATDRETHFYLAGWNGARKEVEANAHFRQALQAAPPAPAAVAVHGDLEKIRVGRLPTMNQDEYPGLGDWWVQLRIGSDGNEVLARVYGNSPEQADARAQALAAAPAQAVAVPQVITDAMILAAWSAAAPERAGDITPFHAAEMKAILAAGIAAAPAQEHATQLAGQGLEKCVCTFAQRVVGDGCRHCNPQEYIDRLHKCLDDYREEADTPAQAQEDARDLEAPEAVEVIGYRISDPCEPDLGFWLSEETGAAWCKSEALTLAAPAAPAVDARAARDAAFEAVRNRLCGLQRYSFVLDDDGVVRRAQDRSGNWIEFDDAHELFDPVAVDAAIDAARAAQGGA